MTSQLQPTYRHLLSPTSLTPWNPLRVIAHCDIDAAYAQFEAVRTGVPDDQPLIVIQWETIIAVNYPARKFGIKRCSTQGPKEARELCPDIVIQHTATYRPGEEESGYWDDANVLTHKVSLDPYRKESGKIMAIFRELVPKGEVEKASIDEAYMDFTPMALDRLLELHPHLATVPPDAPDGLDTPLPPAPPIDWSRAGNLVPTGREMEEVEAARGAGEEYSDDGGGEKGDDGADMMDERERRGETDGSTWEDWALCMGAEIMAEVRKAVWDRLHYTCSAGIAHNKAMAKLCSSYRKPNGQTVLRHAAVPAFLRDRDFTDIRNLGGKLGRCIAEEFQAATVHELTKVSLEDMQAKFGEEVIWVYNLIRGIDHTDLIPRHVNKSMLASKNIIPAITHAEGALTWIDLLAGELNVRLRESREVEPGLWPKTLVLSWRVGYSYDNCRSRQVPFPYTKNLSAGYVGKLGRRMWRGVMRGIFREGKGLQVTNLALQFTGVGRMEHGQRNIEGFLHSKVSPLDGLNVESKPSSSKRSRSSSLAKFELEGDVDVIEIKSEDEGEDDVQEGDGSKVADYSAAPRSTDEDDKSSFRDAQAPCWTCHRCHRLFNLPMYADSNDNEDAYRESLDEVERAQRAEHEDYHFALDLSKAEENGAGNPAAAPAQGHIGRDDSLDRRVVKRTKNNNNSSNKGRKKEVEIGGIRSFFSPKPKA